jgi:hypothetical protein
MCNGLHSFVAGRAIISDFASHSLQEQLRNVTASRVFLGFVSKDGELFNSGFQIIQIS